MFLKDFKQFPTDSLQKSNSLNTVRTWKTLFSYSFLFITESNVLLRLVWNSGMLLRESAKLRALSAKNVLACQRALRAYVPTCLECLRGHVPTYPVCLRAHVPMCISAYEPWVLTCSCVNVPSSITLIHV